MNIQIPKKYKDTKLKETEGMLLAFMTLMAEDNGYEHVYYIHSHDLRKILNTTNLSPTGYQLKKLKEIFNIGEWDENNWSIQFKDKPASFLGRKFKGNQKTQQVRFKLKLQRNEKLWCYLFGMFMGSKAGKLIETTTETFPHVPRDLGTNMTLIQLRNFRIEEDRFHSSKS